MGSFITVYVRMLIFTVGPFLALGLWLWLLRQVFVQLVGTHAGRPFLLVSFALCTFDPLA